MNELLSIPVDEVSYLNQGQFVEAIVDQLEEDSYQGRP
jgi:hypothetical protein